MKKSMIALTAAMMMFSVPVYAENMGVQIIGGPEEETEMEPVSLDDIKIDAEVAIDGFAKIKPTGYAAKDYLSGYLEGTYKTGDANVDYDVYYSGQEAEYVMLKMDLTNTSVTSKEFLEDCQVSVVYDDTYEYAGWAHQYSYDAFSRDFNYNTELHVHANGGELYDDYADFDWFHDEKSDPQEMVIHPNDRFAIDPMYVGHYVFGCTLPNSIIEGAAPLRMTITLGGNEITYHIRR